MMQQPVLSTGSPIHIDFPEGKRVLIVNPDFFNTVYLSDKAGFSVTDLQCVPLPPRSALAIDGTTPIYALTASKTVILSIIPGGMSFFQPGIGGNLIYVTPSGLVDNTDFNTINGLVQNGFSVFCTPGVYNISGDIIWSNASIIGCDDSTIFQPTPTYSGFAMFQPGSHATLKCCRGFGGSGITSNNPAGDFISPQSGATDWVIDNITCDNYNGRVIFILATAAGAHGTIHRIKGEHNAAGYRITAANGPSITIEINISDIDLQNCGDGTNNQGEVAFYANVTDALEAGPINGSIIQGQTFNGITIQGSCQTIHLFGVDLGNGAAPGNPVGNVCVLQAAGGNSPSDIWIKGKLQAGLNGLVVNDGTTRCRFEVDCTRNLQDGAQFNGTGAYNKLDLMANQNGRGLPGVGTAYDFNSTNTAHVMVREPQWASNTVTANFNLALATNHVTITNPPSGTTSTGNPQGGW